MAAIAVAAIAGVLWGTCAVQDLRSRRVSLVVLAALGAVAVSSRSWPWWTVTIAALLWPWRSNAWLLAAPACVVGLITAASAPALGLAAGATAWALGWWGGADAIVLLALCLRHDEVGLIGGAMAALSTGLSILLLRRQSVLRILNAAPRFIARLPTDRSVPTASEMPAAAAMAFAGLIMEVATIWQKCG